MLLLWTRLRFSAPELSGITPKDRKIQNCEIPLTRLPYSALSLLRDEVARDCPRTNSEVPGQPRRKWRHTLQAKMETKR